MQSDIDEREHYDFFRFLWKEMANDAAVAAKIGDFCGVLAGLHYVGDLLGAQLRDQLRRQFILEWQRRLERGDELTSFHALQGLAPATSLDVARDGGERIRRGHHRALDAAIDLPLFLPSRNRFAPRGLFAGTG
jgi:hypothetical protein